MGLLDAVYGSVDHLWLLIGRLTDYGYRDRKRKLKTIKATETDWKPNPGFFKFMARFGKSNPSTSGPPTRVPFGPAQDNRGQRGPDPALASYSKGPGGANQGTPLSSGNNERPSNVGPPMYGMVPSRGSVQLPSAFASTRHDSKQSDQDDDNYEDATYGDAESEWESILAAFELYAQALGRDFLHLPPDATPPISTPFGEALQYRNQKIAVLWSFYYTGRILLYRLHPSMPPAMMVAAGAAASTTAEYGQTIGRIAAGISHPQLLNIEADQLCPVLGSCLVEMTVPIFFSAVQYMDPAQRAWVIVNLRNTSRLTGWKSSDSIASGCERSWVVAGKQGRGPSYQPTTSDDRQPPAEPPSYRKGSSERRFVTVSNSRRIHWAMGILGLEDDVSNLELDDRE